MGSKTLWAVWLACALAWAGPVRADAADDEAARQHFQAGRANFERAEYDDAAQEFERAYRLSGRAPLLINLSRAHESAGRPAEAAEALERWQAAAPADDPMRTEVEARLKRLRAQADKRSPTEAEPPTVAPVAAEETTVRVDAPAAHASTIAPWTLVGGGGAALAAGAVLFVLGRSDISAVEHPGADTRWSDVHAQADRGPRRVGMGLALAGVGLVSVGVGLGWLWLGRKPASDVQARLELTPFGARLRGKF